MKGSFGREPAFTQEGGSIGAELTMRRLLRSPMVFHGYFDRLADIRASRPLQRKGRGV